eukprot:scaffold222579_cov18-Tisochrysis_lutea.AAC.4
MCVCSLHCALDHTIVLLPCAHAAADVALPLCAHLFSGARDAQCLRPTGLLLAGSPPCRQGPARAVCCPKCECTRLSFAK